MVNHKQTVYLHNWQRFSLVLTIVLLCSFWPNTIAAETTQTATATGAVNMRSGPSTAQSILLTIPSGGTATVLGTENGWLHLNYGGTTGWSVAQWFTLRTDGATPPTTPSGQTAVATGYVNVRSGGGTSYPLVLTIPKGAVAQVLAGPVNGWIEVSYNGKTGWTYAAYYNMTSTTPPTDPPVEPTPEPTPPQAPNDQTATAKGYVNVRNGAGTNHAVIVTIPTGGVAQILAGPVNGWIQVSYGGKTGWTMAAHYHMSTTPVPTPEPTPTPGPSPTPEPTPPPTTTGQTAKAKGYVNVRAGGGTNYAIVLTIPTGGVAQVLSGSSNGWIQVAYNGKTGWTLATHYTLSAAAEPTPTPEPSPTPTPEPTPPPVATGQTATAKGYVNVRTGGGTNYAVVMTIPTGGVAQILASPVNGWIQVNYNGKTGWTLASNYILSTTPTPTPDPEPTQNIQGITTAGVNMRNGPSTSYTIATFVPANANVIIHGQQGDWINLTYAGRTGWCHGNWVRTSAAYHLINVPYHSQLYPTRAPTGCENTATLMGLQAKGYALGVSLAQFINNTPTSASDPNQGFVGTQYLPAAQQNGLRTTIYPEPMANYVNNTYGANASNMSGASFDEIVQQTLNGNPVVVWGTAYWNTPTYGTFNINGEQQSLVNNNHVYVTTGYDANNRTIRVADPWSTNGTRLEYWVSESEFNRAYDSRRHAMLIE